MPIPAADPAVDGVTATITGPVKLPGGTAPLEGTWYARIRTLNGATIDYDGTIRGGIQSVYDDGNGATMTLPVGSYEFRFESSALNQATNQPDQFGWYPFDLEDDTLWGVIMETPVEVPVTPSDVTMAQEARDDALQARDEAQAFAGAAQAVGTSNDTVIASRLNDAASETHSAAVALIAANGTTSDATVADKVTNGTQTPTAIDARVGLKATPSPGSRGFSPNPANQIGPSADAYHVTGGTTSQPNRIGNAALANVATYDAHIWNSSIACNNDSPHSICGGSDGHAKCSGGSFNHCFGGYGITEGHKNGVYAAYGSCKGRISSAGANGMTTLAAAAAAGQTSITVADTTGMAVGMWVYIDYGVWLDRAKIASLPGSGVVNLNTFQAVTTTNNAGESTGTALAGKVGGGTTLTTHPVGTVVYFSDGTALDAHSSGYDSHVFASGGQAHGTRCRVYGLRGRATGNDCRADATDSEASGSGAWARNAGEKAHSTSFFNNRGDSQYSEATLKRTTTTATTDTMPVILIPSSTVSWTAKIAARDTSTGDSKAWEMKGLCRVNSGTTVTQVGGAPSPTVIQGDAGAAAWTVSTNTGTTPSINVRVTGEAGKNIDWTVEFEWVTTV